MFCTTTSRLISNHSNTQIAQNLRTGRYCHHSNNYNLSAPIHIFSVEEFGINAAQLFQQHKALFRSLPADWYDVRKAQIELLQRHCPSFRCDSGVADYYRGKLSFNILKPQYEKLNLQQRLQFDGITPWRFRAISQYEILFSDEKTTVKRIKVEPFTQEEALISDGEEFDFRKWPRVFTELPKSAENLTTFQASLIGVANKIRQFEPKILGVKIVAHHVRIIARIGAPADNSPEGIHQDGFPYIVSALVVEREAINGGVSTIYGPDKCTPLLTVQLPEGVGLLQPDLGSPLWHKVSPINIYVNKRLSSPIGEGSRSSIGFDIQLLK